MAILYGAVVTGKFEKHFYSYLYSARFVGDNTNKDEYGDCLF